MTKQWEISDQTKWPKFVYKTTKNDWISDQKMRDMLLGIKYISFQEGPLILEVPLKDQCYVSHFLGVNAFKDLKNFKKFIIAFKA